MTKLDSKNKKDKKATGKKKQKGRIKIVPLVIVCLLIGGMVVFSLFFKNTFVKNALINAVESAAEAKCDIDSVDVSIIGAHIRVDGFAVADKSKPMQNLFAFDSAVIDFDLTQLLLGRFISEEISLSGAVVAGPRETSGALSKKETANIEDAKAEAQSGTTSENSNSSSISSVVSTRAQNGIEEVIAQYNPENLLNSYMQSLNTPKIAENSTQTISELTDYWTKSAPDVVEQGESVFESIEEVKSLADSSINSIDEVQQAINTITTLASESKELQAQTKNILERAQTDAETVHGLMNDINNAIAADTRFVNSEIDKITSLSLDDGQDFLIGSFDTVARSVFDSYYPLVQRVLGLLGKAKDNADTSTAEKKESALQRLKGRTISFNPEMPSFLIKKVAISGVNNAESISLDGTALNITAEQDKINAASTAQILFSVGSYKNEVAVVVDIRSQPEQDTPVFATYNGQFPVKMSSSSVGVPSLDGIANSSAEAEFDFNSDFNITTDVAVNSASLAAKSFEPALVFNLYESVLESITEFSVGAQVRNADSAGITLNLHSDIDTRIAQGLSAGLAKETQELKNRMKDEASNVLKAYADGAAQEVTGFSSSQEAIEVFRNRLENMDSELETYRKSLEKQIADQAKEEAQKVIDEKAEAAKKAAQSQVEKAASNVLKNFF